jgi:hypothetical protein
VEELEPVWVCCGWRKPPTQTSSNSSTIAEDNSYGVTNTRCCNAPNSIPIHIQQDATLHSLFISGNCSYMFREVLLPIIRSANNYLQHLVIVTPLLLSAALVEELELVWVCCGWRSWLRHCATSRKVPDLIPDGAIRIFHWRNPFGYTMALGSTQVLTKMSTRNIFWGWRRPVPRADSLATFMCHCLEIWEPRPPETSRVCPGL